MSTPTVIENTMLSRIYGRGRGCAFSKKILALFLGSWFHKAKTRYLVRNIGFFKFGGNTASFDISEAGILSL